MVKKNTQPARMDRYANIARISRSTPRSRPMKTGKFAWFRNLSRKKKIAIIATPILAFLILTPLITYFMLVNDIRDPERLMNRNNTGIALTDVNDKPYYSIGRAEHRKRVPLDQISDYAKKALIAGEDKDFYKHGGFNLISIARALVTRTGGGSTLTQQLVKNTLLTDEQSYLRKYQELFMAIAVEQNYSKDDILGMYLNSVYFGENAFGIEDAARAYFNKAPKDLTLAESAMLIGVLPAPSAYSPISGNMEYAKKRQNTVLTRMVNNGYITEAEKTAAYNEALKYGTGASKENKTAPHFVEMVINELSKKYGYEKVMRSGYRVKTTLDLDIQSKLEDSVTKGMKHINAMGGSNASGIVLDPKTGDVKALVGSADYNNEQWGKVNMATTARQPGSSFKPIYYSYALADGVITPATRLDDKVKDFGGGYIPRDADRREASRGGQVTVRQSLSWSLNIPSLHLIQKYGIKKTVTAANNLGIGLDSSKDYDLTLALGSSEVPLQKMVNAYAAFANEGRQYDVGLVKQIKDKFDKNIFTATHNSRQAISKEGAYLISNILSDNATRSRVFGSSLNVSGRTVAVKTGTTNDSRDAWTIGYNPEYVIGVWVGNNDNTAMKSGGSDMAGPIWRNTMTKLLQGRKNVQFSMPSSIVQKAVCTANGGLASKSGPNTYNEFFMTGAFPTNSCEAEPTMISVCDIEKGEVISIDEAKFNSTTQSKDTANCKPPTQQVCELSTGKIITINKPDFNSTKHSTDTENCQPPSTGSQVQACDTTTGQIVMVAASQIDGVRYTKNITNCEKSTTNP